MFATKQLLAWRGKIIRRPRTGDVDDDPEVLSVHAISPDCIEPK